MIKLKGKIVAEKNGQIVIDLEDGEDYNIKEGLDVKIEGNFEEWE